MLRMIDTAKRCQSLKTALFACQFIFWFIMVLGFAGAWLDEIERKREKNGGDTQDRGAL